MALTTDEIRSVAAKLAAAGHTLGTQQVRTAASDTDQWVEDNQASYITALSEPFKSASSAEQKSLLFAYVVLRRAGVV